MIIQAILVSIFCYLGSVCTPSYGYTFGWYVLSRPLVGGLVCGLIFGDVTHGILIGVAVQAVYLALVTPGGSFPAELGFVSYPAIAIALASGTDVRIAVTLATTIGVLGTFILNSTLAVNSIFNNMADKAIEKGDYKGIVRAHFLWPQIFQFVIRFIPSFIAVFFGAQYVKVFMAILPPWVITGLMSLGGILPAVGIAILLKQSVRDKSLVAFFLLGFVSIVFMKLNIIAVTILGAVLAIMTYRASSNNSNEEVQQK